jgi:hypothetical protein
MSNVVLDTKDATVVVIGAFNPAIFNPGWVAHNVHGIPDGQEVEVMEVHVQTGPTALLRLNFINGVAFHVLPSRMDVYTSGGSIDNFKRLEEAVAKIFEILPHTPVQGLGLNFKWTDSDPDEACSDFFQTPEGIEKKYVLNVRQSMFQAQLDDCVLNFTRTLSNGAAVFRFNYHQDVENSEKIVAAIANSVSGRIDTCKEILKEFFGYEAFGVTGYDAGLQQGENA